MKTSKIKYILYILIILGALYLGWEFFHSLGPKTSILSEKPNTQLWTCPMHPQIIMDKPGDCPICHMKLVPLKEKPKEEEHKNHKKEDSNNHRDSMSNSQISIHLEPAFIQKMNLRTEKALKKEVEKKLSFVGHVDFDESKIYIINTRVSGWVEKLYAKYEGKYIQAGEVLLAIYSPELVSTQEEYLNLYKQYSLTKQTLGNDNSITKEISKLLLSSRERLKLWNISEYQIQQIERNQKSSRLLYITSPYNGFIIEKKVFEGQKVEQGTDLFKIANLNPIWVFAHIPESEIFYVYLGQKAKVKISQVSTKEYYGKVNYIYPTVETDTRTLKIRIEIPNPKFEIKPGMYANIELFYKFNQPLLVVPYSSVIQTGKRNLLFVFKGNGIVEPKEVEIGLTDGENWIEIKQGIEENENVVVSAQFLLDSETRIRETVEKLKTHQH
ncbi:MAG: efflux RND transporter periplasmic adaptor subunit [Leptonema sp. (in: bacteria)]